MPRLPWLRLLPATVVITLSAGLLATCAGDEAGPADTGDLISPAPYTDDRVEAEQSPTEDPNRSPKSTETGTPAPADGRIQV